MPETAAAKAPASIALQYTKPEPIKLKNHPDFDERWLQDRIAEDTTILGLGELDLIERERRQDHGGRLDLLLADSEEDARYEIELMLGATDESHIIRCIEYWDIERRRYPQYDHCAVLVAEDITSRFLNVLALLNGQIPMIAIQWNALKVGNLIVLDFVRVMDRVSLRSDDIAEASATQTDRDYWIKRSSPSVLKIVDDCLKTINQKANPPQNLTYNKFFIGLNDGTRSRNFVFFAPKKQFLHISAEVEHQQSWTERCEEQGISARSTDGDRFLKVTIKPGEYEKHQNLVAELLLAAVEEYQK